MTSNEIYARVKDNEFVNAPTHRVNVIDENGVIRLSSPCWGLDMAESIAADREGEINGWTVEIVEQENRDEIQAYWDKENTETPNPDNTPTTMNANETTANDIRESVSRLRYELQQYHDNTSKGGTERRRNMILLRWDIRKLERQLKAMETTTVTVSVTDNGNRCEYTDNGKVIAAITYRKEFDTYDVNTPTVGYMTADVTEAHKACESGITWLFEQSGRKAAFDYSPVEDYNAQYELSK